MAKKTGYRTASGTAASMPSHVKNLGTINRTGYAGKGGATSTGRVAKQPLK